MREGPDGESCIVAGGIWLLCWPCPCLNVLFVNLKHFENEYHQSPTRQARRRRDEAPRNLPAHRPRRLTISPPESKESKDLHHNTTRQTDYGPGLPSLYNFSQIGLGLLRILRVCQCTYISYNTFFRLVHENRKRVANFYLGTVTQSTFSTPPEPSASTISTPS